MIAAILGIGLIIGVTVFWTLSRTAQKLGGPPELDSDEDELMEHLDQQIVLIRRDEEPPTNNKDF